MKAWTLVLLWLRSCVLCSFCWGLSGFHGFHVFPVDFAKGLVLAGCSGFGLTRGMVKQCGT